MPTKKIDSPLLVIGLGGTGSEAAKAIRNAFSERLEHADSSDLPRRTHFLVIDTDNDECEKRGWNRDTEFCSIANDYNAIVGGPHGLEPWEAMWFDQNFRDNDGLLASGNGAGVYRQISRLFLFRALNTLTPKLVNAISDIRSVKPGEDPGGKLEIRVLAGISGGTGSGTFLDVAYILRHLMEQSTALHLKREQYTIELTLIMPDVTIEHHATSDTIKQQLYSANGYAALKELDFWMGYQLHHHRYTQKYDNNTVITWDCAPYDDVTLLCAKNVAGANISGAYGHIMSVISEYMVNCFSASDAAIKHMNDSTGVAGKEAFTFASTRSNDLAHLNAMRKDYFVPYRYRSIGAFSNAGDETNIINRQWNLILSATVNHMYDEAILPNMEGTDPLTMKQQALDALIGHTSSSELRKKYESRHPIQGGIFDIVADTLRTMEYTTAPHGNDFDNFLSGIDNSVGDEKKALYNEGVQLLHDYLVESIADTQRGPQYTYTMLMDPQKGLIALIDAEREIARNKRATSDTDVRSFSGHDGTLQGTLNDLKNVGAAGRAAAKISDGARYNQLYNTYIDNAKNLYAAARARGFYDAMDEALKNLKTYAQKFAAVLGDMITGIRARNNHYIELVRAAKDKEATLDLLNRDKVEQSLVAAFNDQQQREAILITAYQTIADTVDRVVGLDRSTISESEVARRLEHGIDGIRRTCFSTIDTMTIEQKIQALGDMNGQTMSEYTKSKIMVTLMTGAQPMFSTAYPLSSTAGNVVESYMGTVPVGMNGIDAGINNYMLTQNNTYANLKYTDDGDRIFWVTSIVGMPMMAYADIANMRNTYNTMRDKHRAVHLCMNQNGTLIDSQRQDWSRLPEPTCPRDKHMTDDEEAVLSYVKSGNLTSTVEFNNLAGVITITPEFSWKQLPPLNGADFISLDTLRDELNMLTANATREQVIARLNEILSTVRINTITSIERPADKAETWANVLGLGQTLQTELTPGMNPYERSRIEDAWRECYQRTLIEFVTRNPQLFDEIRTSSDCINLLNEYLAKYNRPDPETLKANALQFAKYVRYGLAEFYIGGCGFVSELLREQDKEIFNLMEPEYMAKISGDFPGFQYLPDTLQGILYYADKIAGNDRRDVVIKSTHDEIDAAIKSAMKTRQIPDGMKDYVAASNQLISDLKQAKTLLTQQYGAGNVSQEELDTLSAIITAVSADAESFVGLWSRYI